MNHKLGTSPSIELAHEQLRPGEAIRLSSNRSFGLSIGVVLALTGLAPLLKARPANWILLTAASAAFLVGLAYPRALTPLHRIWFRVAVVLHSIMSPVLMAILFFGLLTPIAFLMRVFGRNALELGLSRGDRDASYWNARDSAPGSMKVPF